MIFRYPLASEKKRAKAEQLTDSVYYLSEHIVDVRLQADCLEVEYAGDEEPAAFQERLNRYMRVGLLAKYAPKQISHDNRVRQPAQSWAAAARSSLGGLQLEGDEVGLAQAFDRIFLEIALKSGASQRKYPSLMTTKQMKMGGYLAHFPQHMYGVSEIAHDDAVLRSYREQSDEQKESGAFLQPSGYFLQPCLCFHVYEELARTGVSRVESLSVYTAAGSCFRHEHRSRLSPTRLREFAMREIIYIGEPERVAEIREQLIGLTWSLFEALGLQGYIESATDPFFYEDDSVLMYQQSAHALKYELRSAGNGQPDFSIASFNLCGHVLCEAFGVKSCGHDQSSLHSGCTGFGIDRWVQAFLYAHGRESGRWPKIIQRYLQG
ncbi:aminoacyl--tRNA ligase-related protein [Xylanibacillus composti]|uniref:Aminoacyl-transfer RNA synthetases class-II family profile domain-containing protein n=1 Tax=Xylanibacillus composti TaxID=1572762 RepID=A0A8J4H6G3_9BACL|nr:aminoacyl--tRNA ligase-related protein [Xylanibacillus composti]GIQ69363.1 hypothetical protein XYCOK13_21870 [Xylanibacillus composti]